MAKQITLTDPDEQAALERHEGSGHAAFLTFQELDRWARAASAAFLSFSQAAAVMSNARDSRAMFDSLKA